MLGGAQQISERLAQEVISLGGVAIVRRFSRSVGDVAFLLQSFFLKKTQNIKSRNRG